MSAMRLCVLVARITIETRSVESVCILVAWMMNVVARVDRRLDSSIILRLSFYLLSCWLVAMAVLKAIASPFRAGEEKPIERYKTRVKVAEEDTNYFRRSKKILSSFLGSTSKLKSSAWGHLTWNFSPWRKSKAKRRITTYQHSSNWSWNYPSCLAQMGKAS